MTVDLKILSRRIRCTQTRCKQARERTVSDEFDSLDATEKAAVEAALNRCRGLAAQIAGELRSKRPEHFVDKLSLADFYASLERAAGVLEQLSRQSVDDAPDAVVSFAGAGRECHLVTQVLFRLYFVFPRRLWLTREIPPRPPRDRAAPGALRFPWGRFGSAHAATLVSRSRGRLVIGYSDG